MRISDVSSDVCSSDLRFRAARFKRARLVDEIAELGLTIGTRIEIRREFSETLAHSAQGNPATVIVQLRDGLANKRGGRAWGLFGCRRTQIGAFGLFRRRRLRQKIFRVDEASTSLAEALGGFLLPEAIYIDDLLADSDIGRAHV